MSRWPLPGTTSASSATADRRRRSRRARSTARSARWMSPFAVVAQRAGDRGRDDRRQRAADRLDRGRAERADRGGGDDRAADCRTSPRARPVKNPAIRTRMVWQAVRTRTPTLPRALPATLFRMASDLQLRGVYVPLITPFAADGSVALDAIDAALSRVPRRGRRPASSRSARPASRARSTPTRSAPSSTRARRVCTERAAQLIVGTGTNNTATTIATVAGARRHSAAGRDARRRAVLRAARRRPAIVAHFKAVADASPVPVVALQHRVPHRPQPRARPALLEAAQHPNIVGVKQAAARSRRRHARAARRRARRTSRCSAARTRSSSRSCSWAASARSARRRTSAPSGSSR